MRKFTEKELKKYLQTEVEKIGISEGWIIKDLDGSIETKDLTTESKEIKNETIVESEKIQIEDVKLLAEEVKRMKELIDFRSPLLKKD